MDIGNESLNGRSHAKRKEEKGITNKPLKYLGYTIACQEVPDEVSLIIEISGCPHHCEGCHSPQLWEYEGNYISDDIDELISKYNGMITCVCFMGGDQNINELASFARAVKTKGLKVCVYSGLNSSEKFTVMKSDGLLDYLKIGRYISSRGGLDKETTNQTFYKIQTNSTDDITYRFQKGKLIED